MGRSMCLEFLGNSIPSRIFNKLKINVIGLYFCFTFCKNEIGFV